MGISRLGYTDTSHRSQSKTVDRVFIAVDEHAPKATNRTQWYVSLSRGRDLGLAVVADKKSAMEAVQRGGERLSALELMKDYIGVGDSDAAAALRTSGNPGEKPHRQVSESPRGRAARIGAGNRARVAKETGDATCVIPPTYRS